MTAARSLPVILSAVFFAVGGVSAQTSLDGLESGLTELIYNLLQDEKFPGVHIAFGSPLPGKTGADWDSKAHVDGVIISPTIKVDDEMLMDKGRFCL